MGWPVHDPEGWDEVLQRAVLAKIQDTIPLYGMGPVALRLVQYFAEAEEGTSGRLVFQALTLWAYAYIAGKEGEYLAGKGRKVA